MRMKTVFKTMVLAAMALMWVPTAWSVCADNDYVPVQVVPGDAECLRVCRSVGLYMFELLGQYNGPDKPLVLTFQAGCSATNTSCNFACTAITPPSWPFPFVEDGSYPGGGYYYGLSTCLDIKLYWWHDNSWWVEVFVRRTGCDGCFCFTYDDQLAVEMSSPLSATAGDNEVTLRWATASESQNDRFEISRDGARVGSVRGLGTSASGQAYSWTDETAHNGTTYTYVLESVDFNNARHELGRVTATPTAQAPEAVRDYRLYQNYPNPFNPTTRISFDLPSKATVTLKVYNPMGAVVATLVNGELEAGPQWADFDGSGLTSGLYFYTIQTSGGFSATRKMLLIK